MTVFPGGCSKTAQNTGAKRENAWKKSPDVPQAINSIHHSCTAAPDMKTIVASRTLPLTTGRGVSPHSAPSKQCYWERRVKGLIQVGSSAKQGLESASRHFAKRLDIAGFWFSVARRALSCMLNPDAGTSC